MFLAVSALLIASAVVDDTYDRLERRDPFDRAVPRNGPALIACLPAPPAGYLVSEAALEGIVTSGKGRLALVRLRGGESAFLRVGDRFYDGRVEAIEANQVVFLIDSAKGSCPRCWEDQPDKPIRRQFVLGLRKD